MCFCPHSRWDTLQLGKQLATWLVTGSNPLYENPTLLVHAAGTGPLAVWNMFAIVRSTRRRLVSRGLGSGLPHAVSFSSAMNNASIMAPLSVVALNAAALLASTRRKRSITVMGVSNYRGRDVYDIQGKAVDGGHLLIRFVMRETCCAFSWAALFVESAPNSSVSRAASSGRRATVASAAAFSSLILFSIAAILACLKGNGDNYIT